MDAVVVRKVFGLVGKSILIRAPQDEILPEDDPVKGRKTGKVKPAWRR